MYKHNVYINLNLFNLYVNLHGRYYEVDFTDKVIVYKTIPPVM